MNMDLALKLLPLAASLWSAAFAVYLWRRSEIRQADLLRWADKCIEELQTLAVITRPGSTRWLEEELRRERIQKVALATSILLEQGRLLFRNVQVSGREAGNKPTAYLGFRPIVLDHLLEAHTIAIHWEGEDERGQQLLSEEARELARAYVSQMQMEVGRARQFARRAGNAGLKALDANGLKDRAARRSSEH